MPWKIFQLMNYSGLTQNLMPDGSTPHRRLVGHFIRRSAGTSLAYQMLWLSMQYNLNEGLVPAEMIIREKAPQPYVLQNAMLAIAKLGDQGHIPILEPYLSNEQPVNNLGVSTCTASSSCHHSQHHPFCHHPRHHPFCHHPCQRHPRPRKHSQSA